MIVLSMPFTTFAAPIKNPMHDTDVMEDLRTKGYGLEDYPRDTSAEFVSLIEFFEYGYHVYGNQNYYGLYVYLYNPSGKQIYENGSYIQLSYRNKNYENTPYAKYPLRIMSVSDEPGFENVLYKFYIPSSVNIARDILDGTRVYYISGIELQYSNIIGEKAIDYPLGKSKFLFWGYQENFGPNGAKTELHYKAEYLETIDIDLQAASWFSNTSDLGKDYRYEVSSVYFNIPNYYIDKYGDPTNKNSETSGLYSVQGTYSKYVTNGVMLPKDYDDIKDFKWIINRDLNTESIKNNGYCYPLGVGFYAGGRWQGVLLPKNAQSIEYDLCFNMYSKGEYDGRDYSADVRITRLCNYFEACTEGIPYVDQATFLQQYNSLGRNKFTVESGWSEKHILSGIFENLGANQNYSISVDDGNLNSSIKSLASSFVSNTDSELDREFTSWFGNLLFKKLWVDENGYPDIEPIVEIKSSDFSSLNVPSANAQKLFVTQADYTSLSSFYDEHKSSSHVYLMRFDVNPYYCPEVKLCSTSGECYYGPAHENAANYEKGYYFEKAIYEDFDILQFTFKNEEGGISVIPVNCDPVDIVGSIIPGNNEIMDNPNDALDEGRDDSMDWPKKLADLFGDLKLLYKILVIIGVIILFFVLLSLFAKLIGSTVGAILGGVGKVITAPFKAMSKSFDAAEKRRDKRIDNDYKRFSIENMQEKTRIAKDIEADRKADRIIDNNIKLNREADRHEAHVLDSEAKRNRLKHESDEKHLVIKTKKKK